MTEHLKTSHNQPKPLVAVRDMPHSNFKSVPPTQPILKTSDAKDAKDTQAVAHTKLSKTLPSWQNKNKPDLMRQFLKRGRNRTDAAPEINGIDGEKVRLLIHELPSKYKKVIHLRYIKILSLKEIALITGQTQNAVAVQIHRGIEKLKALYSDS